MVKKIKKISSRRIILGTALVLVALFVAGGLFRFANETLSRKNGSYKTETWQATDFEISSMIEVDGGLKATDNDPQLIMNRVQKISSIRFYMEYTFHPGEVTMYYTQPGDTAFSERKRVWATPVLGRENWYLIEMPMTEVSSVRIDPTMYGGNVLTFGDFIFNEEKSFADYFAVSSGDVFNLVLYTGIISSLLKFIQEMITRKFD